MSEKELTIEVVRSNRNKLHHSVVMENSVFVLQNNTMTHTFTIIPRVFPSREEAITYCADNREEINLLGLEDYNKYYILFGQEVRPLV